MMEQPIPHEHKVSLCEIWRAGRSRRWHTHADVAQTNDPLDGHHARVAKLMLALVPDVSRDALIAALTHDDGEPSVGDMSYRVKIENPQFYAELDDMERRARDKMWGFPHCINEREQSLLNLCDRLDSWLWVSHHVPQIMSRPEWVAMREHLKTLAASLDLLGHVDEVL